MQCRSVTPHIWAHDGPDSTLYGLEPNFGCCTANYHQGWPKFVEHQFLRSPDGGLVAALYGPATVTVPDIAGGVTVVETTDYPFADTLNFTVTAHAPFPMYFRVPGWVRSASLVVNGRSVAVGPAGNLTKVLLSSGTSQLMLTLSCGITIERRFNNAAAINRGPLLFAIRVMEAWTTLKTYAYQSADYQVVNASAWNVGLLVNDAAPESTLKYQVVGSPGTKPFCPENPPVVIQAQGRVLPGWGEDTNAAAAPPTSPVHSASPLTSYTLIPFGSTKLRIAEIPTLDG